MSLIAFSLFFYCSLAIRFAIYIYIYIYICMYEYVGVVGSMFYAQLGL